MFKVGDVLRVPNECPSAFREVIRVDGATFTIRYKTQHTTDFPHRHHRFEVDQEATTELRFKKDLEELLHG